MSLGLCVEPDELPFGAYHGDPAYAESDLNRRDDLCFNYFAEYNNVLDADKIDRLFDHGMMAIRGGLIDSFPNPRRWHAEAPFKYSWSCYAEINVDSPYPNPEVRMVGFGGYYSDGQWISPSESVDTLTGISTYTPEFPNEQGMPKNRVAFNDKDFYHFPAPEKIEYDVDLFMSIDEPDTSSSEVVARISAKLGDWAAPCSMYTVESWDVTVGQFLGDTLQRITVGNFIIPDTIRVKMGCNDSLYTVYGKENLNLPWCPYLMLEIATTGAREVAIDKIVISDDPGRRLVEENQFDAQMDSLFRIYASQADKIYGWFLMDEPLYANFLPFAHIEELMQDVAPEWKLYTENCHYQRGSRSITRSWLNVVDEEYVTPNIYVFGINNPYAGDLYQNDPDWTDSPLKRLHEHLHWVRQDVNDEGKNFWIILQAHDEATSYHRFRLPTASEFACQTFMSLAWGARGINYYFYEWPSYGNGIIDIYGQPTSLYSEIRDYVGPYIQAFDEYYMPLDWDTCYVYNPSNPSFPSTAFIEGVSASSDSYNPDLGWFQFGQYHDPSTDEQYLMILNRACNVDSSTIAPSISVVFNLDDDNLSGDHSYYVIDLARGVEYDDSTQKWQPVPETTYTALMPDGTIPFTTTFRAGEGRLFKIVQAQEKILHGTLDTNLIYQGGVKINGDITVPAGGTFRVKAPARFNIGACDIMHSGKDTTLAEIICSGRLSFIGTENDSIYFANFYDCDATLVTPTPGIWYGIRDCSAGQDSRA
jgi:hypothetical protein